MTTSLRKWRAVFALHLMDGLAYPATVVIWLLTDLLPAFIMPLVWLGAYNGRAQISGYDPSQMVMYYLVVVFLASFITSHLMWDIATEIKEGQFSLYLVRPFSYFQHQLVRNLAWRVMRTSLFIPMGLLLFAYYRHHFSADNLYLGWHVWVAVGLGHLLSFVFVYAMALIALWVQEVYSIFGLYYFPMIFLSGQLTPLSVLPDWANTLANILPFRYTTGFPAELIVGKLSPSAGTAQIGIQLGYTVLLYFVGRLMWRSGLKKYTAVGM